MAPSLFTKLDAEWLEFTQQASSTEKLRRWAEQDALLRQFLDLGALVRYVQTPGHPAESDDILSCLVPRCGSDPTAARTLLQAVLYALIPIAVRFRPAAGDAEEANAVVIAAAYDRIRTYPAARRPHRIAANIVLDTQQVVSRNLCRPRVEETLVGEVESLPVAAIMQTTAADQLIDVVAEALRRRRLCQSDARVIVLTRLFDIPIDDLAAEKGCLPHSLRRRRLRAEAALAAAVA
jgi:hypothetical protein